MRFSNLGMLLVLVLAAVVATSAQADCTGPAIFDSQSCPGDAVTAKEMELFNVVNAYRAANGQSPLRLSTPLSKLGNRRMLDLNQNMKSNTHSWSNCRYDINDQATWPCLTTSPTRLNVGYTGEGYETLFRTTRSNAEPAAALEAWKKSELHSSIILNKGMFEKMPWEEIGVAIDGSYAALWFGYRREAPVGPTTASSLGLSLEQVLAGLPGTLNSPAAGAANPNTWKGTSADTKTNLLITGSQKNLSLIELTIAATPGISGTIGHEQTAVISRLLKNVFPEWQEVDSWIATSMRMLAESPKGWRKTTMQDRVVEFRGLGADGISLVIKPYEKPKVIEMD